MQQFSGHRTVWTQSSLQEIILHDTRQSSGTHGSPRGIRQPPGNMRALRKWTTSMIFGSFRVRRAPMIRASDLQDIGKSTGKRQYFCHRKSSKTHGEPLEHLLRITHYSLQYLWNPRRYWIVSKTHSKQKNTLQDTRPSRLYPAETSSRTHGWRHNSLPEYWSALRHMAAPKADAGMLEPTPTTGSLQYLTRAQVQLPGHQGGQPGTQHLNRHKLGYLARVCSQLTLALNYWIALEQAKGIFQSGNAQVMLCSPTLRIIKER